jgi:hypothetical protein
MNALGWILSFACLALTASLLIALKVGVGLATENERLRRRPEGTKNRSVSFPFLGESRPGQRSSPTS